MGALLNLPVENREVPAVSILPPLAVVLAAQPQIKGPVQLTEVAPLRRNDDRLIYSTGIRGSAG